MIVVEEVDAAVELAVENIIVLAAELAMYIYVHCDLSISRREEIAIAGSRIM